MAHRTYSVPAQLMGHTVEARVHANVVEVRYRDQVVQTMPRLRKEDEHRIDYRHVIGWLVRKPGAFARYRYREDLYPSVTFRRAYDALGADAWRARRRRVPADPAAGRHRRRSAAWPRSSRPCSIRSAASTTSRCKPQVAPPVLTVPVIHIPAPDLTVYDALRAGAAA